MISFLLSLLALVVGYFIYGKFVEHVFAPDDRSTPAIAKADGVDFVVMPAWKIFMIQFLNIAGTGPIFGAIMGAWYGPKAYLWIVLGCIFAGAMHDYMSGMLSVRHGGANLPELVGCYLGKRTKKLMLVFSVMLLLMVGTVFVYSPAIILNNLWNIGLLVWVFVIFAYYMVATMLPIDKIIGKIYPLFAFSLLFMAVALLAGLIIKMPHLPELWSNAADCNNNNPAQMLGVENFMTKNPLFPCLFITIACGAISGFHATQSPLMARCLKDERQGRPIFYGAMITEGLVALIWATVSMYFFYYGGWKDVVGPEKVAAFMQQWDNGGGKTLVQYFSAPDVVQLVCSSWLGLFGGVLAWQMENPDGFNTIWQYFGWANQTLSVFTLWTITVYLCQKKKPFVISLVPALFMTTVCSTFLFVSPQALGLDTTIGYCLGAVVLVIACVWFYAWFRRAGNRTGKDLK